MADAAGEGARMKRAYEQRSYAVKVAMVQRVCRRLEAGETLNEACRDPTLPQRSTVAHWRKRHAELGDMLAAAEAAAAQPRRRAYHHFDETVTQAFLERIEDGRGLREVCAEPDMPAHCTITRWLNERPAFARAYRQAREAQADRLFDLAWRIACEAEADDWRVAKLKIDAIKWRIGKLVPRKYGPWKPPQEAAPAPQYRVEVRRFALAPGRKVKDITVLARGLDAAELEALQQDIAAGRLDVPDRPALAENEHIAGAMLWTEVPPET